ncbi:hypothetical protein E2C01_099320 [Portunus trituberculatus]|uniref:Uncharacterized protein n=1 Tax=Portunus trituberculatus TaxID=210409 RepID=A0A5B7K570_PORTR|nr:hypothetical protein [Portunus trituberculatus]
MLEGEEATQAAVTS